MAAMRAFEHDTAKRSPAEIRRAMEAIAQVYTPILRKVTRDRVVKAGVPAEWIAPKRGASRATVLYFHGGGYVFGSVKTHAELIARIALATPARVLAPEYRLAPEAPFPAALDDATAVYRALLADGVDPKRLVVAGDSAGGGLAAALLLRLKAAGDPLPAGAVLICPWLDMTASGGSFETNAAFDWLGQLTGDTCKVHYLQGHDPSDPLVSPALGDLAGLPPLLVQIGGAELLLDQSVAFEARAKAAGVDVRLAVTPDMVHDWHSFAGLFPELTRAFDEIGAFVRDVTKA